MNHYLIGLFIWVGMVAITFLWLSSNSTIPEERPPRPTLPAYGVTEHYDYKVSVEINHTGAARVAKCHITDINILCK